MATYSELMSQAQALMAQAEKVRKEELANVISTIKSQIREYGLSADDLGLGASGAGRKAAVGKSKAPAKYKGPNGELWSGGPGRKPEWVKKVLEAGGNIENFRI